MIYSIYEKICLILSKRMILNRLCLKMVILVIHREKHWIGQKVLGANTDVKYSDLVEEIEISRICDVLANNLKVNEFKLGDKEGNIDKYLKGIRAFIKEIPSKKSEPSEREYYARIHDMYAEQMMKQGANSCSSHKTFVQEIEVLNSLQDKDVYEKVKAKLIDAKYYKKIFE